MCADKYGQIGGYLWDYYSEALLFLNRKLILTKYLISYCTFGAGITYTSPGYTILSNIGLGLEIFPGKFRRNSISLEAKMISNIKKSMFSYSYCFIHLK